MPDFYASTVVLTSQNCRNVLAMKADSRNVTCVQVSRCTAFGIDSTALTIGTSLRSCRYRYINVSTSTQTTIREKADLPLDQLLTSSHLLKQRRVPNNSRRILHFPTRLIQPRNHPHDRALHHVRQISDPVERHPPRPLVHHLHHTEARLADKVI